MTCLPRLLPSILLIGTLILPAEGTRCAEPAAIGLSARRDTFLLAGGILCYVAGNAAVDNLSAETTVDADRNDVWFAERFVVDHYSREYIPLSNSTRNISLLLPVLTAIPAFLDSDTPVQTLMVHATVSFETMLFAAGITNLAKGIAKRKRPYYYNPDEPAWRRQSAVASRSFWSGHTVVAFASAVNAAVMFQEYHPGSRWVKPVWIGGLSIATIAGALQVASGDHFPSDIIAAAAVGSLAGWLVPRLHRNSGTAGSRAWRPVFTGNGIAIVF